MSTFEQRTCHDLTEMKCSYTALGVLADISTGRISECLSGSREFSPAEVAAVQDALDRMKLLVQTMPGGIPIDFRQSRIIKLYFDRQRAFETDARDQKRQQILSILREIKLPVRTFMQMQFENVLDEWAISKLLNGVEHDDRELCGLLSLAEKLKKLQRELQIDTPQEWSDFAASIRETLEREAAPQSPGVFDPTARA
jgi:hypothetical protein